MMLEQHAIGTKFTGSHLPWQLGHGERHGALLGIAWCAPEDSIVALFSGKPWVCYTSWAFVALFDEMSVF